MSTKIYKLEYVLTNMYCSWRYLSTMYERFRKIHFWLVVWNMFFIFSIYWDKSTNMYRRFRRKIHIWLVVWNLFPYIGNNTPNWRTHLFRGVETTNQYKLFFLGGGRFKQTELTNHVICEYNLVLKMWHFIHCLMVPKWSKCSKSGGREEDTVLDPTVV